MSYKKYFYTAIRRHYPNESEDLARRINQKFEALLPDVSFARTSSNPIDRRLVFAAYFLAMVQVLDDGGESFDAIRKISLEIAEDYVRPKNRAQAFFKRLPVYLLGIPGTASLLKIFNQKVSVRGHPDGFVAKIITDKEKTFGLGYGIEIQECGICKLFKKHHAEKYASILCDVDEITSSLAGLTLIRTGTIAKGATCCDFRFSKAG